MSKFDTNDLKSEINTILNIVVDSMETSNVFPTKYSPQKNILKTSGNGFIQAENKTEVYNEFLSETSEKSFIKRPHTLEDFIQKEVLEICNLQSTFEVNKLNKDEEVWVMDIPGTIDPMQLKNQIIQLGDKSKFKIGEDRYYAINKDSKCSLTCIFNTDTDPMVYKAVNVKPAGTINIRRKLSGLSKKKLQFEKSVGVPYPQNVKNRHPFFGVQFER